MFLSILRLQLPINLRGAHFSPTGERAAFPHTFWHCFGVKDACILRPPEG